MLTEIQCDNFISSGNPRPTIKFQQGLNTVLGSSGGSNAIGKSTFLMIIDFVFGGDSYIKMSGDIKRHIGFHTINFAFRFDEKDYFFTRGTEEPGYVCQCDNNYKLIKKITLDNFRRLLFEKYSIDLPSLGFNDISERFFRVYGRGNTSEKRPLNSSLRERDEPAIDFLMKLFNRYGALEAVKTAEEQIGVRVRHIESRLQVLTVEKLEQNEAEIAAMQKRLNSLLRDRQEAQLQEMGFDSRTVEMVEGLQKEIKTLERKRHRLVSQLNAVESNTTDDDKLMVNDFGSLLRFFPNTDIKALVEIEHFHNRIAEILSEEMALEIERLRPMIAYYDTEISRLQKKIADSGIAQEVSRRTLSQCVSLTRQIEKLEEENKELNRLRELQEQRTKAERMLSELLERQTEKLLTVQDIINQKMNYINDIITDNQEVPPVLQISPQKIFEFETPDNTSEGTSYKSLVVYDLSVLGLTPVPALIHDSNILVHIENAHFERILEMYQQSGKQVFIAFDKADKCTPKAREILEATARIRLSDGDELFGMSWSKRELDIQ